MFYTVGEIAKKLNVPNSTIRYYDKEGLFPFIERSDGGIRMFKDADIESLRIIECLKQTGMSIKNIKTFIDWVQMGDETIDLRLEMFNSQRKILEEQMRQLEDTLATINYKCWYYECAKEHGSTDIPHQMPLNELPPSIRKYKEKLSQLPCSDN